MPKLVASMSTRVIRDGKRVKPETGKAFDYTKDEIADLEAAGVKFRKPQNEDDDGAVATDASVTGKAGVKPSAEASQAKARGGEKTATANKSDEEASDDDL